MHSTPRRKPVNNEKVPKVTKSHKSNKTLADLDLEEEDAILKRMEEILLTYKCRVETHLGTVSHKMSKITIFG